jgi:hypothetical protein
VSIFKWLALGLTGALLALPLSALSDDRDRKDWKGRHGHHYDGKRDYRHGKWDDHRRGHHRHWKDDDRMRHHGHWRHGRDHWKDRAHWNDHKRDWKHHRSDWKRGDDVRRARWAR